jgi:hypothetical protein
MNANPRLKISEKYALSLLILFAFSLPLSVGLANLCAGAILFIWLFFGDKKETLRQIRSSKAVQALIVYCLFFIVEFIVAGFPESGFFEAKKAVYLLMVPVFMSFLKRDRNVDVYLWAFVLGVFVCHIFSYLLLAGFYQLVPSHGGAPFINRIHYSLLLAFSLVFLLYFFHKPYDKNKRFYLIALLSMGINLFIQDGKSGLFVAVCQIPIFYVILSGKLRWAFIALSVCITAIGLSYFLGSPLKDRLDKAYIDLQSASHGEFNRVRSTLTRVLLIRNSLEMIKSSPWLGIGMGNYEQEYKKIIKSKNLDVIPYDHPHNQYLFMATQFGIWSILFLLWIFFEQFRFYFKNRTSPYRTLIFLIPLGYFLMAFLENPLMGMPSMPAFVLFFALLFRNVES